MNVIRPINTVSLNMLGISATIHGSPASIPAQRQYLLILHILRCANGALNHHHKCKCQEFLHLFPAPCHIVLLRWNWVERDMGWQVNMKEDCIYGMFSDQCTTFYKCVFQQCVSVFLVCLHMCMFHWNIRMSWKFSQNLGMAWDLDAKQHFLLLVVISMFSYSE